jgi:hypothetical protein
VLLVHIVVPLFQQVLRTPRTRAHRLNVYAFGVPRRHDKLHQQTVLFDKLQMPLSLMLVEA